MKSFPFRLTLAVVATALILVGVAPVASQDGGQPPVPGPLTALGSIMPTAINDAGQVAGHAGNQAALLQPDGTLIGLGVLGTGNWSVATGINARGQIVGYGPTVAYSSVQSFLWTPDQPNGSGGSMTVLSGGALTFAQGINDYGQVAGYTYSPNNRTFLWTPSSPGGTTGQFADLGSGFGFRINQVGQVVGGGISPQGRQVPFLWTPSTPNGSAGQMVLLPEPPAAQYVEYTIAQDINSAGQVVGFYFGQDAQDTWGNHAFLWTPNTPNGSTGTMVELPSLPGQTVAVASAINDSGQVVGISAEPYPDSPYFEIGPRPVVWQAGAVVDLALELAGEGHAFDINNLGQAVLTVDGQAYRVHVPPPAPPTPEEAAEVIATEVEALIQSGLLNAQEGQGLQSRLDTAVQRFSSGNTTAGVNVLNAFNNKVRALVNSGRLSADNGASLIDASNAIINQAGG